MPEDFKDLQKKAWNLVKHADYDYLRKDRPFPKAMKNELTRAEVHVVTATPSLPPDEQEEARLLLDGIDIVIRQNEVIKKRDISETLLLERYKGTGY